MKFGQRNEISAEKGNLQQRVVVNQESKKCGHFNNILELFKYWCKQKQIFNNDRPRKKTLEYSQKHQRRG